MVVVAGVAGVVLLAGGEVHGQGRGGGAWTTTAGDAQRTSSVRTDPKISAQSMQKPGFQFLWKRKLDPQTQSLTQPILLPNIIAYKGFKALAFVGGSSDNVYAIDYDLNRMFWQQHLATGSATAGTAACPGGLTAITKSTAAVPPAPGGRGRGPGGPGGRGPGAPAIAGGRGGGDNVFAISSGGMVHVMNPQIGTDQIPPVKFLPANAKVAGSILVDNVLYAATTGNCGGAANGVWAVDLISDAKPVTTWGSQGAAIAGAAAPTFGTDSTIYVVTGGGVSPVSNAVVSLEPKTLKQKDWFAGTAPFTATPIVFQYNGKDLIVAANKDGRLYVLDSAAIGGADHKTPLSRTSRFSTAGDTTGLTTWVDAAGTRWVAASSNGAVHADTKFPMANGAVTTGAIAAFTLVEQNGAPTLQPQWVSRDLASPVTPVAVNGVVFALASGEFIGPGATTAAQRAKRSSAAVLYALDAATGKELWTSGNTITSFVPGVGPSAGDSQVYVVTQDSTLYAFGIPMER
jgi:putative pyrroloquinoline-quinone binding quinoprotein